MDRSPHTAAELLVAHRDALASAVGGETDHCILFTRIAVDVARKRGVLARPLAVSVELRSSRQPDVPFLLGFKESLPQNAPLDAWDGHLVAILDRRLMVDLSIDSATSPELGIKPTAFAVEVSRDFITGGELEVRIEGGVARYRAHPDRVDFRELPAWRPGSPEQIAALADALLWHPEQGI